MAVFASRQIVMPVLHVTVMITGAGNSTGCYATINGTKQYSAGTHEVKARDTITFGVVGVSKPSYNGSVTIDGMEALRVTSGYTETYDWTVPSGISTIEIAMKFNGAFSTRNGRITVTTA